MQCTARLVSVIKWCFHQQWPGAFSIAKTEPPLTRNHLGNIPWAGMLGWIFCYWLRESYIVQWQYKKKNKNREKIEVILKVGRQSRILISGQLLTKSANYLINKQAEANWPKYSHLWAGTPWLLLPRIWRIFIYMHGMRTDIIIHICSPYIGWEYLETVI